MDTINDSLKVIEETIKNQNLEGATIGIICNSNNIYNESNGKYEMEGAKANYDCYQMSDYYTKLVTDHPLISYLQDPMADSDLTGWHYLCQQMPQTSNQVMISCASLFSKGLEKIKEVNLKRLQLFWSRKALMKKIKKLKNILINLMKLIVKNSIQIALF